MLVLLVSADDVVVDDALPLEDGSPPPSLTFQGRDVEGPGGRLQPGPDLVYRLAGRADLYGAQLAELHAAAVEENIGSTAVYAALEELRELPVYLELAPSVAEAFQTAQAVRHPVAGPPVPRPRPHLQLAPPPVEDPTPCTAYPERACTMPKACAGTVSCLKLEGELPVEPADR